MIHTTPLGTCQAVCRPVINFSVATFLFISGYLTKTENDNWGNFCKKRIIRVLIPYVIWTVLYTLPAIISGKENFEQEHSARRSTVDGVVTYSKASIALVAKHTPKLFRH
jgi:fucose 4-O-acetylase-like acetyltransferase